MPMDQNLPVIICGAGPAGMTAALFLARAGVPVHVLERNLEIFDDPRAATFHPPTMEMFDEVGITQMLHEQGIICPTWQFRDRSAGLVAEYDLSVLSDDTRYPYRLQCEQHKLVRMLTQKLAEYPHAQVTRGAEVIDVRQDEQTVEVVLGSGEVVAGGWAIGTDGGRSVVRKSQEIGFEGFTYDERFLVVTTTFDFATIGLAFSNYVSDPREWAALFKVPGTTPEGLWRVVFPASLEDDETFLLSHAHAQSQLQNFLPNDGAYEIVHTNLYQVHQRVATQYRRGRVFLAGDAAHINNPLGGMGMNFGIHDAVSLAEKLAAVINEGADDSTLDRYDRQRRHVANTYLQAMTIQNKKVMEERDPEVRKLRQQEMRDTVGDRAKLHAFLYRTSMIEGLRAAAAIP
jgi:3-(3-hydroxy-phenyl)propionate hydroxylase